MNGEQNGNRVAELDSAGLAALGLKKETVFVPLEPKRKSSGAERVARHRERKAKEIAEAGLVQALIPREAAERIAFHGNFDAWLEQVRVDAVASIPPAAPSTEALVGSRMLQLNGWRRTLVNLLLG